MTDQEQEENSLRKSEAPNWQRAFLFSGAISACAIVAAVVLQWLHH